MTMNATRRTAIGILASCGFPDVIQQDMNLSTITKTTAMISNFVIRLTSKNFSESM